MDHKLQKFLAIVEHGGFSVAAREIHVSQPALTITMNELEKEMGVKLLVRKKGHFGLTPVGVMVYEVARRMRSDLRALEQALAERAGSQKIAIHIGMVDSVAGLLFAEDRQGLMEGMEVKVDNSDRLINDLKLGRLELAVIVGQSLARAPGVMYRKLGYEDFVFVGRSEVIATEDLAHIDNWLAFNQASNTYSLFMSEFEKRKMRVTPVFYSTSMDLLKTMALRGRGVALLPLHFCAEEIESGNLACLDVPVLKRPLMLALPAGQTLPPRALQVVERLERLFQKS